MRDVETHDIILAATLKVKGCELDRIHKNGNQGTFCFTNVDEAILNEFNLGRSLVEPLSFNNAVKALTTAVRRMP